MDTNSRSNLERQSQLMSNDSDLSRSRVGSDAKISSSNGGLQGPSPSDLMNPQYMNVQKVPDSISKGLSESLAGGLLDHNVVDLEASEFSQQSIVGSQYYDDDILSQGLTDDDRRLAAALVAVQLSKSNNQTNPSSSDQQPPPQPPPQQAQMLPSDLLNTKQLSSMSPIDKPAMPGMVPNYMQSVEDAVVHEQLSLLERSSHIFPSAPSQTSLSSSSTNMSGVKVEIKEENLFQVDDKNNVMKNDPNDTSNMSNSEDMANDSNANDSNNTSSNSDANNTGAMDEGMPDMSDDDENSGNLDDFDSDYEIESRPSRKSLPHKKRIPKKLKRGTTMAPTRNPHAKGAKPSKQKDAASSAAAAMAKMGKGGKDAALKCELCTKTFLNQLKFFEHLKSHYEPLITISTPGTSGKNETVSSTSSMDEGSNRISQNDFTSALELSSSDKSQVKSEHVITTPPLSCSHCGKTFRRPKALETHIAMSHGKHDDEMDDFSEPEDMMEGIGDVVGMVQGIDEKNSSRTSDTSTSGVADWQPPKRKRGRPRKADVAARAAAAAAAAENNEDNADWRPPPPPTERKRGRPKKAWKEAELARQRWLNDNDATPTMVGADSTDNGFGLDMDLMSPFVSEKTKKPKKTLACTLCPRVFNHRNSLMYHVRSHSGQRPHQCEVCGKSFFAASALKVHLRLHSGAKPYKCEFCERHFRQWGDLKYHITSIHTDQKQFQCEYCGKDFARKYSLIVHRRIHTGEKNYICEFCHKSFRASSYLQNHRRIHTGEKPHQCQICGKPFRVRSDMKRHVATHNKAMVTSSHLQNDVNQRLGLMPSANDHHSAHVAHAAHAVHAAHAAHAAHSSVVRGQDGTISLSKIDNEHAHNDHYKNMKNPQLLVRYDEEQDSALPDGSSCSAPLNLNIRPHSDSDDGLAYSRESLERESSTLYVWIPAGADHLLPD